MSDFYTFSGTPSTSSNVQSSPIRSEFSSIETAFNKLPTLSTNPSEFLVVNAGGTAVETKTAEETRIAIGLPVLSTNPSEFLVVNAGGTAIESKTAAETRTALSLAIGTNVQAWDANLDQIAALAPTDNNFIVGNGSAWALETPASARTSMGAISIADLITNNIVGTTTNDSATVGNIGEIRTGTAAINSIALTSSTPIDICSVSLPAGNWDVSCQAYFTPNGTTSWSILEIGSSTVSGTVQTNFGQFSQETRTAMVTGGNILCQNTIPYNYKLASTTTIYMVGYATFTVSTMSAGGIIRALRIR